MHKKLFDIHRLIWMLLASLVMVGALAASPVLAAGSALVLPDPLSVGMKSGEEKTVSIRVENATDLYGIEFQVSFDPNVVQVPDADDSLEGVQIAVGDWMADGFVAANKVDNEAGTVLFAATLLNPAEPLNGDGTVATIPFAAQGDGTSPLKITKTLLATRDAQETQSEAQDGAIGVSAQGQARRVNTASSSSNRDTSSNTRADAGISTNTLILAGAAGIGVLGFFAAVLLLGGILWMKRR